MKIYTPFDFSQLQSIKLLARRPGSILPAEESHSWVLMWVPPHSLLWPHGTYTHNELKSQFFKN